MVFQRGVAYSRAEIHTALGGGGIQEYLPSKNGIILAGCFVPELNPQAPERVYVGSGPRIIRQAELATIQKQPIPCFLKHGNKEYVYKGNYRPQRLVRDPAVIKAAELETGRNDISGVLVFEPFMDGGH